MRLGIDAREAFSSRRTGKGIWVASVIAELTRRGNDLTLFLDSPLHPGGPILRAESTKIITFAPGLSWHWHVARALRRNATGINLYLSPTSFIVPRLVGKHFPCAVVIHDLIAFHKESHDRKATMIECLTLPKVLETAKHIFVVSEATKRELLDRFPRMDARKIAVVYAGPTSDQLPFDSAQGRQDASSPIQEHLPPAQPYILTIGTLCPRKNQLRLIEAFNLLPAPLRKRTKLLLIGKRGWQDEEIVALARKSPHVEWRGYATDAERDVLLRGATVFAYPSLMEGFGLPVLDALARGIPTLTSDRSSLPEAAGDAALLVDPQDTEAIAEGLRRLLTDDGLRKRLHEEGPRRAGSFTWERTVNAILGALRKA